MNKYNLPATSFTINFFVSIFNSIIHLDYIYTLFHPTFSKEEKREIKKRKVYSAELKSGFTQLVYSRAFIVFKIKN